MRVHIESNRKILKLRGRFFLELEDTAIGPFHDLEQAQRAADIYRHGLELELERPRYSSA